MNEKNLVPTVEKEEQEKVRNPKEFLEMFRESDGYKQGYSEFFEEKTLADDVTEDEKRRTFEGDETCRKLLIDFAQFSEMTLVYSSSDYPEQFKDAINLYWGHLKDHQKSRFRDAEALASYDTLRGRYHNDASKILEDEYGISSRLSRGLVQIITVNKGLEIYDHVSQDERRRLQAMYN